MSIEERSWEEFQETGMLWWVNRILHLFGWCIVVEMDEKGKVGKAYPARCNYRGFPRDAEESGFARLTEHLHTEMPKMIRDTKS